MECKAVKEMESRIQKIMAGRETEKADLKERVENAKQRKQKAFELMDKATIAGDVKAYRNAKAERQEAEDMIEMFGKRIGDLENKPLIDKAEYEKGIAKILTDLSNVTAESKKLIVGHVEQIRIIAAECTAEIERGNAALRKWQHEIYRDTAEQELANGKKIHMEDLEQKYRDYSVSQFAGVMLENPIYKNFTGQSR